MASFGDFEVVEEIDSDGYTTVYRARKTGTIRDYALKLFNVTRHLSPSGTAETVSRSVGDAHELGEAVELKYLEAVKLQRRTAEGGAPNVAPVYEFGTDERGAWFVTDFYPRKALSNRLRLSEGANAEELTWIIHSILRGLLALKAVGGRSHGQLRSAKILLGGRPRTPLRRTPIHITDPVAGPVNVVDCELSDLRALGKLIYELVHRRQIDAEEVAFLVSAPSENWANLGDRAGFWRDLCQELLHPRLSLDKTSIEKLAGQIRPRRSLLVPVLCGGVTAAVVAGGIALWIVHDPGPRISKIESIEIWDGDTVAIAFTLSLGKTKTGPPPITSDVDRRELLQGVEIRGTNNTRYLVLAAQTNVTGRTKLRLRVGSGAKTNERTVAVTVNLRNTPPRFGAIPRLQQLKVNSETQKVFVPVTDRETPPDKLKLTATSSSQTLIRKIEPIYVGTNWFLSVRPEPNQTGQTVITVVAMDRKLKGTHQLSDTNVFVLSVINTPPTIQVEGTNRVVVAAGSPVPPVMFLVSDDETTAENLEITPVSSTNPALVPKANIKVTKKQLGRTASITPTRGQTGSTLITFAVNDGLATNVATLVVTVNPPNTPPSIASLTNQTVIQGEPIPPFPLLVRDAETADLRNLRLWATSTSQALLPSGNISTEYGKSAWQLSFRPITNQYGSTTITVFVSDGEFTTNMSFLLTVKPKPVTAPPPSLVFAAISDVVTNMNWPLDRIPVQLIASNLRNGELAEVSLVADSSNSNLIPTNQITARREGTNWILSMIPLPNQTGPASIKLTVKLDRLRLQASTNFQVTINNRRPEFFTFIPTNTSAMTGTTAGPISVAIRDDGPTNSWRVWVKEPATMAMTVDAQRDRTNSWNVRVRGTNQTPQRIDVFVSDGQLTNATNFLVTFTNPPVQVPRSIAIRGLPTGTVMTNMNSKIALSGIQLRATGFSPEGNPGFVSSGYDTNLIAKVEARPESDRSATNWTVTVLPRNYATGIVSITLKADWDGIPATSQFGVWFTNRPPYFTSLSATSVTARVGELTPSITIHASDPEGKKDDLVVGPGDLSASGIASSDVVVKRIPSAWQVQVRGTKAGGPIEIPLIVSDRQSVGTTKFSVAFTNAPTLTSINNTNVQPNGATQATATVAGPNPGELAALDVELARMEVMFRTREKSPSILDARGKPVEPRPTQDLDRRLRLNSLEKLDKILKKGFEAAGIPSTDERYKRIERLSEKITNW